MTGSWQLDGTRLTLRTDREAAAFDIIQDTPTETLRLSNGFPSWENSCAPSLTLMNIEFVKTKGQAA